MTSILCQQPNGFCFLFGLEVRYCYPFSIRSIPFYHGFARPFCPYPFIIKKIHLFYLQLFNSIQFKWVTIDNNFRCVVHIDRQYLYAHITKHKHWPVLISLHRINWENAIMAKIHAEIVYFLCVRQTDNGSEIDNAWFIRAQEHIA